MRVDDAQRAAPERLEEDAAALGGVAQDGVGWSMIAGAPTVQRTLEVTPINLDEANAFVALHHRHHRPVPGAKFCIACSDDGGVVHGVVIVGRPIARMLDNGWTLEVNRCCTDGVPNGCSMLYGAARRAAWALGYRRLITYTLPEEGGASLRASGWKLLGERGGGEWSRTSRPRIDAHPTQAKLMWEAPL